MPRFKKRMRTRSPWRTISGVVAGPARPFSSSQLNSMFMVFGVVPFGSTQYSCRWITKSFSQCGRYGTFGCITTAPSMPAISCIAMCEW